jgi:predicted DNA-binding antitoxin AbrB/MazE fold protein
LSSDSEDSDLEQLTVALGPQKPVYDTRKTGYSALEIVKILMKETSSSKICTRKPCGVRTYSSFLIDFNSVGLKDINADDNGSWVTSSPQRSFSVKKDGDEIISLTQCTRGSLTLYRQYGVHKGTPQFRRVISTVYENGRLIPRAVVQYFFTEGKKVVVKIPSHGNSSKVSRPYYRTQPSTITKIKEECKRETPAVAYHKMIHCSGETLSEEPRNKTQIYNDKKVFW